MAARELLPAPAVTLHRNAEEPSESLFRQPGRKLLHVGCGPYRKADVQSGLWGNGWREVRLDIDPAVQPDIAASMLDMSTVPDASVDVVYSSHNVEHLYPHEVPTALAEFLRVLKPAGFLLLTCPDLQSICRLIAEDNLDQPAYMSPAGAITPHDVLYGYQPQLAAGNLFMAHHTGFTLKTLMQIIRTAGFRSVAGQRREAAFALWVLATKSPIPDEELQHLAKEHFPP
ncbi:MAG: methyltransferase domain-containing protein [Betaproteobacteria bacterium]|nr:methyltransferase domain-containing protein [Betaproteobacteria bacterium]